MPRWRLILSPPLDGASNMAVDEALYNIGNIPTLRFYAWSRPTLSLGRFQKTLDGLPDRCRTLGVDLVRRPTGGRMVLHQHELTYSVSAPHGDFPAPPELKAVYERLACWQIEALRRCGVEASRECRGTSLPYQDRVACFGASTPFEIGVAGRKISGSAQKRGKEGFLQHGSILMNADAKLWQSFFGEEEVAPRYTTLEAEGCRLPKEALVSFFAESFEATLGCRLAEGELTEEETAEAGRLRSFYSNCPIMDNHKTLSSGRGQ